MTNKRQSIVYSLLMVGIALSFPVQIMWMFEYSPSEFLATFTRLTTLNWITMGSIFAVAAGAQFGPRLWLPLAGLAIVTVMANNLLVALANDIYFGWAQTTLSTLGFSVVALGPQLLAWLKLSRKVEAAPNRRVAERVSFSEPVTLVFGRALIHEVHAFDISSTGIFVQAPIGDFYGLTPGDKLSIQWLGSDQAVVERQATVVRVADSRGQYPRGVGLRFDQSAQSEMQSH